ncbi:MAG: hypothetical protein ACPGSD_00150 [Flavobacteriales bacterium]
MNSERKELLNQILKAITASLIVEESETERSMLAGSYLDLVLILNLPQTPSEAFIFQILKTNLKALVHEDCETERGIIVGTYYELLEKLE